MQWPHTYFVSLCVPTKLKKSIKSLVLSDSCIFSVKFSDKLDRLKCFEIKGCLETIKTYSLSVKFSLKSGGAPQFSSCLFGTHVALCVVIAGAHHVVCSFELH